MAKGNIKGISVEINGETGPLQNALKDVNKSSYNLKSELKEVERALKLDPKNTVLLAQKQDLLAKSITNTKEKLETLKTAEQQAQQQFARGEISEEQYRALQREVINTEQELGRLETAARNSNSTMNRIAETSDKIAKGSKKVGQAMTPVTVAIGGMAIGAVAAFTVVDEGMDIVIKKTGATGKTAKELEVIYKDLASSVPDSMADVGAAVGEINTRFEFTGETLKKASADFLKFARINDMDVNSSVQLVSRAMSDAGIKSSDYNSVLDKLTVAAQKSGIGIDSLTTNLAKYGAPMRALGIDTDTSIAMFAGWEKAGVNTEIAFGGMKQAIGKWGKEGKDSTKEFEKTLKAIKDAPNITDATGLAIETFGQRAGADLADAIQGGRFEVANYVKALEDSEGAVTNTYDGIESGTDKAKIAFNAMKVAGGELGETIMQTLAPILKSIAEKAKILADKFAGLSDGQKKTILIVLAVIAAIAPLALVISAIATVAGVLSTAAAGLGVAFTFLTGPIGLIILAVVAVIAIGVLLYKNWDVVKAFMIKIFQGISDFAVNVFDGLIAFFKKWGPLMLAIITGPIGLLVFAIIKNWDKIKSVTSSVFNGIKNIASSVWNSIKSTISGVVNGINSTVSGVWNKIKSTTSNVWNGIKTAITTPFDAAKNIIKSAIDKIKGFLNFSWSFPKLKMPHFSVTGSINPIDWLKQGVPKLGVNWYDKGAVFNQPSVIGIAEKRPEFVGALDDLRAIVGDEIKKASGNNIGNLLHTDNVNINNGMDIENLANELGFYMKQKELGGSLA